MLFLRRVIYPYEWVKSSVTGKPIRYPSFYYEDDVDDFVIEAEIYHKLKRQQQIEKFDYTRLQNAQSQYEYDQMVEEYTRQYLIDSVLERDVAKTGRETPKYNGRFE